MEDKALPRVSREGGLVLEQRGGLGAVVGPQKGAGSRCGESEMQCTLALSPVWHSSPEGCASGPLCPLLPLDLQEAIVPNLHRACPQPPTLHSLSLYFHSYI